MIDAKPTILVIEDDLDIAEMLDAYFQIQGYEVLTPNWGDDGVSAADKSQPDPEILDLHLPDIDGYEVAKRLRKNRRTMNIKIIFLTDKRSRADLLKGLDIGGDDYVTKLFDMQELRLRVRNSNQRNSQGSLTNPVTGLPDGVLVSEQLEKLVQEKGWVMLLVALKNLESFRESYGFVTSEDVLRAVSLLVQNALGEVKSPKNLLGHLTPTEMIIVTQPKFKKELQERLALRLEQSLDYIYPIKDRIKSGERNNPLAIHICRLNGDADNFTNVKSLTTVLLGCDS